MRVIFTQEAERDLKRLSRDIASRIVSKILWHAENFQKQVPQPLGAGFKEFFKLRVGDWRVVYEADPVAQLLVVHLVDHRSKIYERRP